MRTDLGATEIDELLDDLDSRLRTRGIPAAIYLVGGAAMIRHGMTGRRTRDVDGVIASEAAVLIAAAAVGESRGLPLSWLSTSARPWVPVAPAGTLALPKEPGLAVRVASIEHLLAMKLVAFRRTDQPDIVFLADALGLVDAEPAAFVDLLERVYGEGLETMLGPGEDQALRTAEQAVALLTRWRSGGGTTPTGWAEGEPPRFPRRGRRHRRAEE